MRTLYYGKSIRYQYAFCIGTSCRVYVEEIFFLSLLYWVLSSDEVKNNRYYSIGQHRGNVGEGQLWLKETNIDDFNEYEVTVRDILNAIVKKANKE